MQDISLQRVPADFISMFMSALELCLELKDKKEQFMKLLKMIKENKYLSSRYDHIHLVGEERPKSPIKGSFKRALGQGASTLYEFKTKHCRITDCHLGSSSECGFILRRFDRSKVELSQDTRDYDRSSVHIHGDVRVENIFWYARWTGETSDGDRWKVTLPLKNWIWLKGVVRPENWELGEQCVDYNISDFLVANC